MAEFIAIIIAYLLGSVSSSIVLAKLFHFPDPRTVGSGNAGASNILRTVGKNQAVVVLIGDVLKGLLAVGIARLFGVYGFGLAFVALAAVVGHVYPVFFKFRGGKGVATAIGAILGLSLFVGILLIIVWVAIAFLLRLASLASLAAAICAPIFILMFSWSAYFIPVLLITVLIVWKHWDNIERLRAGTENKIKF
jgi:glycerol-3-phosphate acyltransferase PlsY